MSQDRAKRKLSPIFRADFEGYSRLMGEDNTVRIVIACRELMTTIIEKYRDRVVDYPGDNVLHEFGSIN